MIGELTIEKANFNISYMLASVCVLKQAAGWMSRESFIYEMSNIMECSPMTPDGKENRVPYNKTKFDRYFGFIDVDQDTKALCLTPRGKRLYDLIEEDDDVADPESRFFLADNCKVAMRELFLDSVNFDAFGSYNCGAETSNSDVEPPKVILRLLNDFGPCSKNEIGYVLWGLDCGAFANWKDALNHVARNRRDITWNYQDTFEEWGKQNFVDDFKLLELLSFDKINLVSYDGFSGRYSLAEDLSSEQKTQISRLSPFITPMHCFLSGSCYGKAVANSWVTNSILGRFAAEGMIFRCDVNRMTQSQMEEVLAAALVAAFRHRRHGVFADNETKKTHWNDVVTFVIENIVNPSVLESILAPVSIALERKCRFRDNDHGWSMRGASNQSLYAKVAAEVPSVSHFGTGVIVFPANFNIIGVY